MNRKNNNQNDDDWAPAKNYKYGTFTSGFQDNYTFENDNKTNYDGVKENDTYRLYVEMATGVSDNTKLKNIYDLGGNMYEWTTEIGYHKTEPIVVETSNTKFAVLRGGSFYNSMSDTPVSYRGGGYPVNCTNPHFGFRVVLYVK